MLTARIAESTGGDEGRVSGAAGEDPECKGESGELIGEFHVNLIVMEVEWRRVWE